MKRREFMALLSGAAITWPLTARAQEKLFHIGLLGGLDPSSSTRFIQPFLNALRQLGYVDNRNFIMNYQWAEGRFERFPELAANLVRLNVDIIVSSVDAAALAARRATDKIPIVTVAVSDPMTLGLAASLAHPGGNVTGLSTLTIDLSAKQLQFLKEALPQAARIAVLVNTANPGMTLQLDQTQAAAEKLGVQLVVQDVSGPESFSEIFARIRSERIDAILALADPLFFPLRDRILGFAAEERLPTMHGFREFTETGGLMSYGVNLSENYRRAATYVDKILKGTKPGDIPIEQPTKFELVINLKTAKALGLIIPPSLLARADEVIE